VDTGDTLALVAGISLVIIVAVMANPQYLSLRQVPAEGAGRPMVTTEPAGILVPVTSASPGQTPGVPADLKKTEAPLYRISLTDKPFTYPVYTIPPNMEQFGASAILPRTQDWVPFAFIENNRGGLTQVFSVPYPLWAINTTIIAEKRPQYGVFRMVLCYAETGGIIKGEEIFNRGTSYRLVQTSNTDMYMIISPENIDSYRITFETPRNYYDNFSSSRNIVRQP
jgi:hypothetical protein